MRSSVGTMERAAMAASSSVSCVSPTAQVSASASAMDSSGRVSQVVPGRGVEGLDMEEACWVLC